MYKINNSEGIQKYYTHIYFINLTNFKCNHKHPLPLTYELIPRGWYALFVELLYCKL